MLIAFEGTEDWPGPDDIISPWTQQPGGTQDRPVANEERNVDEDGDGYIQSRGNKLIGREVRCSSNVPPTSNL